MYSKMPFGLINAGATFQRAMDISFSEERDKFVVIYLDDITIFSKRDEKHFQHLERVFQKYMKFGVSLNPKKSHLSLQEGKLLGHIISKDGIIIDPSRVEAIEKIDIPRSRKEIHSFIRKVNFVRRLIPNCAEIMKSITDMLKKDNEIRWTKEGRKCFANIKRELTQALVLISPNFNKDFQIYSFSLEHTIVGILLQKNNEGLELLMI
jgi:hypothetical protein